MPADTQANRQKERKTGLYE